MPFVDAAFMGSSSKIKFFFLSSAKKKKFLLSGKSEMDPEIRQIVDKLKPLCKRSMKRLYFDRVFGKWIYVWRKSESAWMTRIRHPSWFTMTMTWFLKTATGTNIRVMRFTHEIKYKSFKMDRFEKKRVSLKNQILPR